MFSIRMLLKNVIKGIRRPIPGRPFCLETKRMDCESCVWNKNRLTEVPFCIFSNCIYKRSEKQDGKAVEIQNHRRVANND